MRFRLLMLVILLALVAASVLMPRVTEKDAVAHAHAMVLAYCNQHDLPLDTYEKPLFHVEGGDKTLIFVYRFLPKAVKSTTNITESVSTLTIRIDKWGNHVLSTQTQGSEQTLKRK